MSMKTIPYLFLITILLKSCATPKTDEISVSLFWKMGKNQVEEGFYENTFLLVNEGNKPLDKHWIIYFNQMPAAIKSDNNLPAHIQQISSSYYKIFPSSSYRELAPKDTLAITFRAQGSILKNSGAPEGAYIVGKDKNGKELPPKSILIRAEPFKYDFQWSRTGFDELPYPDGNYLYEKNKILSKEVHLRKTDIFPSIKSVKELGGKFSFTKEVSLKYDPEFENEALLLKEKLHFLYQCEIAENAPTQIFLKKQTATVINSEYYEMDLNNGQVEIRGANPHAIFNGIQTLLAMIHTPKLPYELPNVAIVDYPDLLYRGQMLDVARNFTTKENLLKLIDILSFYKINVLHLHLTDDEGWRLQIPDLEELTEVGAQRGHTTDERTCLYPAYGGGWDATDKKSPANGFYTRQDFLEILKYAKARHIKIIPEIDLPGHARAAIKAMNARYYKYIKTNKEKAEEYLLTDFNDTSEYISAQSYTDNVINVALSSTYRFVRKVVDEIEAMYKEADVELSILHLGGDEVPNGAWTKSKIATDFMQEKGFKEIRQLKDYFIEQVIAILAHKNISLGAWQEVALLPDESVNEKFAKTNVLSYCWNTVPDWNADEIPYRLANANYPVILCNVSNLYFDLSYSKHPDEPGAYWAGFVNEYDSFNVVPYDIYKSVRENMSGEKIDIVQKSKEKLPLISNKHKNIKGIQGQLWTETIRNFDMVAYYLFPKLFGLVERSWNAYPQWANDPFGVDYVYDLQLYKEKIFNYELPRLANLNINFRVPPAGIKIIDNQLHINSPISNAQIYYTTDGTEPTLNSPLWTNPFPVQTKDIRAKVFYHNKWSTTTILSIE